MKEELTSEFFQHIAALLQEVLGEPEQLHQMSPLSYCSSALEVLLATLLTQATSDQNALKAWQNFKKTYPNPEEVLHKSPELLYEVIRPAGMNYQRGNAIIKILQQVYSELGEYSLDSLKKNPQLAWDFLNKLPGVGPKTAACTLLFGLQIPYFPVDVHIERIAKRQGWVNSKLTPKEIQDELNKRIPHHLHSTIHILLLNLGRNYCRPHNPHCVQCPIQSSCKTGSKFT